MTKKLFLLPALMIGVIMLAGCDMSFQTESNTNTESEVTVYDENSRKDIIPETCQSFNDGCNQCIRGEDGEVSCTRMFCEVYEKPYCTDDENEDLEIDTSNEVSSSVDKDLYIGKTFEEAKIQAELDGVPIRAVEIDGEPQAVTADYMIGRLNVSVQDDIVTSVSIEGQENQESYIGLTLEEAQAQAEASDRPFRVVSIDGEAQPVTMDLRPGRLNASLENGIVTDIDVE